jgi:hypothetical protein
MQREAQPLDRFDTVQTLVHEARPDIQIIRNRDSSGRREGSSPNVACDSLIVIVEMHGDCIINARGHRSTLHHNQHISLPLQVSPGAHAEKVVLKT